MAHPTHNNHSPYGPSPSLPPQWTQLQTRKKNMKTLFDSMRDYQFEKVREQPDKILTEDTRALTDEDLMRWVGLS